MYISSADAGVSVNFNETTTALDDDDGPPAWILITAFFCFLVATALLISIVPFIYHLSSRSAITTTANNEQGSNKLKKRDSTGLDAETLDNIAPARKFKNVQSEHAKLLPGQTESSLSCVICLDIFENDSTVRALPCHHIFHSDCITKWFLNRHATCPLCIARFIPNSALPTIPPRAQPRPQHRPAPASDDEERRSLG
jgi:hypothetical protein